MTFSRYVRSRAITFLILPSFESHVTLCKPATSEDTRSSLKKNVKAKILRQDYCSEAHLTRRLNDLGCKNVINVSQPEENWRSC